MKLKTTEARSRIMRSIKSKNTRPEILIRSALHKAGYRYSLKRRFPEIRCTPDIVMVSRKVVIFFDGCFWHGCIKCYKPPKKNKKYWLPKIQKNKERDFSQTSWLTKNGWKVLRIKEHELNAKLLKDLPNLIKIMMKDF